MPDQRLQKTRATLPTGYQFGDSASLDQAEPRLLEAAKRAEPIIGEPILIRLSRSYDQDFTLPAPNVAPPVRATASPWWTVRNGRLVNINPRREF